MISRRAALLTVTVPALALSGLGVLAAPEVAAASCKTVTISDGPAVSPSHVSVTTAGCVTFTNHASSAIQVKIDSYDSGRVTSGHASTYQATTVGTHSGRVYQFILGAFSKSTSVSVSVTPASTSSPKPTPHKSSKHGGSSPSPTHSRRVTGPDVAPSPKHHHHHSHGSHRGGGAAGPSPTVSLPPLPPLSTVTSNPQPGTNPLVAPSASPSADDGFGGLASLSPSPSVSVLSGPVESTGDSDVGLPAAVAALLILGVGSGLARVVLTRRR